MTVRRRSAVCWLAALGMTAAMFALIFLVLDPQYAVNDDSGILRPFMGFETGEPAHFHIYLHGLLAWPLHWLGLAVPGVAWLSWMQLAFLFLASAVCQKSIMQRFAGAKKPLWLGALFALAFTCAFVLPYATRITFTQTAALLGAAAVLQILSVDHAEASYGAVLRGMGLALVLLVLAYGVVRFLRYRLRLRQEVQISKLERQKTEELNHAKLQFFTNVTHELMTPLTIILTSLQNLNNGTGDNQTLYGVMSANATRLMRLIQQILEFRKVESGNLKIRVSHGDVVGFVRRCVEAFAPLVARKQLKVYFRASSEQVDGWFDPDKLDKIVYNLLSNAAKYTPDKGEIIIRIETGDDCSVCISVANSGELMTQQTIDGLFRRFYDGNYRKHHTIGTGIGLSLVKDLTDLHRGSIRVSSDEQDGNCFRITLPIGRDAYTEEEIDDDTGDDAAEKIYEGAGEFVPVQPDAAMTDTPSRTRTDHTLLVVDDNEELLLLISNLLAPYFRIETASDGEEALRILSRQPVDLVVSDIMMPGMDGIELCRRIKQTFEYCHIPVILLTAKNADESRIEGYNSGADGYVTKPFNLQLLYAQIVNQLRKLEIRGLHFRNQPVFEVEKLEYTSMDEKFMRQAMACVNAHIDDCEFAQADFTREMNMSRTILTEKLKSLTGLTPAAFIIDVRLRAAYHLLEEQKKMRIADLAYASGFNDPKYFSTCFRKKFGFSPKEFIDRLNEKGDKIA